MDDIKEILSLQDGAEQVDHGDHDGNKRVGRKRGSLKAKEFTPKRPEGMHRELYSLLCADGGKRFDELAPVYPSDRHGGGYQKKLKLGAKKVRQWKWTPFTNPARKDGAVFCHWRRVTDEPKEYPFAKFNKAPAVVTYSDEEYATHLESDDWSRPATDHLLDLCRRFNLRFTVVNDRWDTQTFGQKSMEDLKERYYNIANVINRLHVEPGQDPPKPYNFDAEHEKRRKEQLNKLWSRTPEQIEEEEFLRAELKKIEARKRERDKKTQDLQKLITAADAGSAADNLMPPPGTPGISSSLKKNASESRRAAIISAKKKTGKALQTVRGRDSFGVTNASEVFQGIKWPDFKTAGAFVRSQKMKLPGSVGQKKLKALELILQKLHVDIIQIPTEDIVSGFNDLRSDIVLLYELKSMLTACDMEIQSIVHQYQAITGQKLEVPVELLAEASNLVQSFETGGPGRSSSTPVASSLAASLAVNDLDLPNRKRKAALEQSNILKKLKSKIL